MAQKNIEFAQRAFAAFNRGDVATVLAMLSPDVEVYSSPELANPGTFHGHDGFLEWSGRWLEVWETFRVEANDFMAEGDDVVVSAHQYGRGKGSGIEVEMDAAYLLTVRDGKSVRFHLYPDKADALEAVGPRE